MKYSFINIALLAFLGIHTQDPPILGQSMAFEAGEKLSYRIWYQWGLLWVNTGSAMFETQSATFQNKKCWLFRMESTSMTKYDWFFKVREKYESYVDTEHFLPLWAQRNSYEGNQKIYENYLFNYQLKKVYYNVISPKITRINDSLPLNPNYAIYDLLSAIYYIRNMTSTGKYPGDKFYCWATLLGKIYPLSIRYHGKCWVENSNKKRYYCSLFSTSLSEGTIFRGNENIMVWVTDDSHRIAVRMQAKIIIGSIIAELDTDELSSN